MGKNPSFHLIVPEGGKADRLPVDSVSWQDCQEFLKKLNKRPELAKTFGKTSTCVLPKEDEWEYAYRGKKGNGQPFYWGNELNGDQANCRGEVPFGTEKKGQYLKRTCEVDDTNEGKYAVHPWGLHHMSGNVCEWCENIHTSPDKHNQCGGSWFSAAFDCRAVSRFTEFQIPGVDLRDFFKMSSGLRVCIRLE
jgi:formylglycine-generating enzyme